MGGKITTFAGGAEKSTPPTLHLDTLEHCRESMARVIDEYAAGRVSENQARALCYMLSQLLAYWKVEMDYQIEQRIAAIEQALEAMR